MPLNILQYLRHAPSVVRKLPVLHKYNLLLDGASPEQLQTSLHAWRIFRQNRGYMRSLIENKCVDSQGKPIPWYTYPAIEQLSSWDFGDCDVLEYGSGNSTLWWMNRAKSVTSIESSPPWYEYVSKAVKDNCTMLLSPVDMDTDDEKQLADYIQRVNQLGSFDVIIIDGVNKPGARMACTKEALSHLRPGGLFIVDNADWLPDTCKYMRDAGFMEIDFTGLSPLNTHAETTSIFFKADFRIKPKNQDHPGWAIGGLERYCDVRQKENKTNAQLN